MADLGSREPDLTRTALIINGSHFTQGSGMLIFLVALSLASTSGRLSAADASRPAAPRRVAVVSRSRYWRACKARRRSAQARGTLAGGATGAAVGVVAMATPIGAAVGLVAGHYVGRAHVHCPDQASRSALHRHPQ